MQGAKLRDEPSTIGIPDLKPIRYTTRWMPYEWQTDWFIQTFMRGSME